MKITGKIVDVIRRRIYGGVLIIENGRITEIKEKDKFQNQYICPGLIDSHIHIESSMVTPGSFSYEAVSRGTTAVISDPHEIANVLGIDGINFMIEDSGKVPLKFYFGAPSCVPATTSESSGADINSEEVYKLLQRNEIKYLSEMMNFPGVINGDKEVMNKINGAIKLNKPIDGHAPGLSGDALRKYIKAGISTDHECSSIDEAMEKIGLGMKVLIREGSAARNLDALKSLIRSHNDMVMLCSDDLHPEMLVKGHINAIVSRLISEGFDIFDVLTACTLNPVVHYKLDAGLLRPGDPADFIIVNDLQKFNVNETWIDGVKVYEDGKVLFEYSGDRGRNNFKCSEVSMDDIKIAREGERARIIKATDGELLTTEIIADIQGLDKVEPDTRRDILKIVVKDRYRDHPPAVALINGFNLKNGAFASSVAHDSHNIICIGTNDIDIANAINTIVKMKGGLAVSLDGNASGLALPVAGIMSDLPVSETAEHYERLSGMVKSLGCAMKAPFMTLSFMALLVIPELKLSDSGLFDGRKFRHVPLFI